jgi:hypothetical protein
MHLGPDKLTISKLDCNTPGVTVEATAHLQ